MINRARDGFDPNGDRITESTPDRPSFFLSRRSAVKHLEEYPREFSRQFHVEVRKVRVGKWLLKIWVAVPTVWPLQTSLAEAYLNEDRI